MQNHYLNNLSLASQLKQMQTTLMIIMKTTMYPIQSHHLILSFLMYLRIPVKGWLLTTTFPPSPSDCWTWISYTKIIQCSVGCNYSLLFGKITGMISLIYLNLRRKTASYINWWPHVDYIWEALLINSRRRCGFQVDQGSKGGLKHGYMPYTLHCLRGDVVH